jgi:hypothetical protein
MLCYGPLDEPAQPPSLPSGVLFEAMDGSSWPGVALTLSTPDGDSLFATYDGTQGQPNANNFITDASGTVTFTEGTGLFKGDNGKGTFTAVFSLGQALGFYIVDGKLSADAD